MQAFLFSTKQGQLLQYPQGTHHDTLPLHPQGVGRVCLAEVLAPSGGKAAEAATTSLKGKECSV